MAVCAAVGDVLAGSHATLDALFEAAGAPGPPPNLAHHSKWKTWLARAGNDPNVDSLAVLGNVLEEFMDLGPEESSPQFAEWSKKRERVVKVLEEHGFRYYQGGRVLPNGMVAPVISAAEVAAELKKDAMPRKPSSVHELILTLVRGLPRAMHPLTHRRKGATPLTFASEYDIQDLLHSLLRPWVADIRPEEFVPSYAGSSTRMDFLLPAHKMVLEMKLVRDRAHGRKVGEELIVDIGHYRRHPECETLWCVVYDPNHHIPNPPGLARDLDGRHASKDGTVSALVLIVAP